jgi:hypothetical protein
MRFDPLATYSSMIPGVLHYVPGGFCLPPRRSVSQVDALPEPAPRRPSLAITAEDGVWTTLWKTYAQVFTLAWR